MRSTWKSKLLLAGLSAGLALLAAEAGLRGWLAWRDRDAGDLAAALHRSARADLDEARGLYSLFGLVEASEHPGVVYQLKPNLDGLFRDRPVATNSHGLRGPELAVEKPPGVFRIAAIGDSHLFGWGVGQEETYAARLQQLLDRAAPGRFQVLNFGVPGYNATMEVATFEHRALAFQPDLVVMHFVGNDFELPHFMLPPGERRQREAARGPVLPRLARAAFDRLVHGPAESELLRHGLTDLPEELDAEEVEGQYDAMKGWHGYESAMRRLAELAAERSLPVAVMLLGTGDEHRRRVVRIARRHGFATLDAAPFFRAWLDARGVARHPRRRYWKEAFILPDDGHPTPLAHHLYARVLYRHLARRGLVPPLPGEGLAARGVSASAMESEGFFVRSRRQEEE